MFDTIRLENQGGTALLKLDRSEKLNAFTPQMCAELVDAFDRIDADDDIRAVVVTGAGRAFCAGADLSGGAATFDPAANLAHVSAAENTAHPDQDELRDTGGRVTLRIFQCLKPVIAAINGPAIGIGATMTLPMDVRIASSDARFGFIFARRGVVPEAASSWFLPRIVPMARALEWCLSGRMISAEEALAGGLVNHVVDAEDLLNAALALAAEINDVAPVSATLTRQMLWRMQGVSSPMEAHRLDSRLMRERGASRDAYEGVASFLERRPPAYPDRVSRDMPQSFPWWPAADDSW